MIPLVNSPWIGAISFALGAILLAFMLYGGLRLVLGSHIAQDTAPLSTSVITRLGALHSLILALMFAQEMQNYLRVGASLTKEAAAVGNVYYKLQYFEKDDPETIAEIRMKIAKYLEAFLDTEQASLATTSSSRYAWEWYTEIERDFLELPSETTHHKDMRAEIRKNWDVISAYRRTYQEASARKIPGFFWALAILGFAFITIPFHAFQPKPSNLTVMTVFAAYNGIVIFFIYAMNNPFTGAAPIEPVALEQLYTEIMSGQQGR